MSASKKHNLRPYLIIGNGRTAKHFSHYFQLLNIPFYQWSRTQADGPHTLFELAQLSERILLLISDRAIEIFISEHTFLKTKILVHFSGALNTPLAYSAHPLNTFNENLYSLETYLNTPFVIDSAAPPFNELLPGLPNKSYTLDSEHKSFYHALCVMSGNFTTLLWQNVFKNFEQKLNLPRTLLYPYLNQVKNNLELNADTALTGPLTRDDGVIISRNLAALESRPEQALYRAFLNYYNEVRHEYK